MEDNKYGKYRKKKTTTIKKWRRGLQNNIIVQKKIQ